MSKKNVSHTNPLHKLIEAHQASIQANAEPFEIAIALLRVVHQINMANDRITALSDFLAHPGNKSLCGNLRAFFHQDDLAIQPRHAYLHSVHAFMLEKVLTTLAPGAVCELSLDYFNTLRHTAKRHLFNVGIQGIYEIKHDPWEISPEASELEIGAEHFTALNKVLAMLFNHPMQLDLEQAYRSKKVLVAMEQQSQVILHSLYMLEYGWEENTLPADAPLAALLTSVETITQEDSDAATPPHLPPLDVLASLGLYLRSATVGSPHKTLTERLQHAAHSHPEHYRIALNRMIRELFRQHFLVEMNETFDITLQMPDEQGRYKVNVHAPVFPSLKKQYALTDRHLAALTWMVESLFNHAEELGLPNNVWRKGDEA